MMQELQRLKEQLAQGKTEAYEAASAGDIKAESECRLGKHRGKLRSRQCIKRRYLGRQCRSREYLSR